MTDWKSQWNARYGEEVYAYGTEPNEWIRQELPKLSPGKVLCAAEGQGRNAVFAASLGWDVHGFDLSEEGVRRAMELAQKNGQNIRMEAGDVREIKYPEQSFDALILVFAHFPSAFRKEAHEQLLGFLKPGASILFEAFSKEQLEYQKKYPSGGPREAEMLFSLEEVKKEFPGCRFIELSSGEVELNEGPYHQGKGHTVRFVAVKE